MFIQKKFYFAVVVDRCICTLYPSTTTFFTTSIHFPTFHLSPCSLLAAPPTTLSTTPPLPTLNPASVFLAKSIGLPPFAPCRACMWLAAAAYTSAPRTGERSVTAKE